MVISTQYKEEFSIKTIQRKKKHSKRDQAIFGGPIAETEQLFGETLKRRFLHWLRCWISIDFIVLESKNLRG